MQIQQPVCANGASDFLVHSPTDPAQGVVVAEFDPAVFEGKSEKIFDGSKCVAIIHSVPINYCVNSIGMGIHSSSANHLFLHLLNCFLWWKTRYTYHERGPKHLLTFRSSYAVFSAKSLPQSVVMW